MRLIRVLLVSAAVSLAVPVSSASATSREAGMERIPAGKKGKKKGAQKKRMAKKKAGKKARHAKPRKSAKRARKAMKASPVSHAPTSHYPTQPGGSGFETPNEMKDDLPPPQVGAGGE